MSGETEWPLAASSSGCRPFEDGVHEAADAGLEDRHRDQISPHLGEAP